MPVWNRKSGPRACSAVPVVTSLRLDAGTIRRPGSRLASTCPAASCTITPTTAPLSGSSFTAWSTFCCSVCACSPRHITSAPTNIIFRILQRSVLVSGGAGFIGSHVTVELIEAGYDVVVADNFSNCDLTCFEGVKKITGRDDIPLVEMDFCDAEAVKKIFADYPIDAVIHFAAFKAVGESVAKPLMYYQNNLLSFMNVLQAAQEKGGCNVLFSSSATVYGEPEVVPVTEKTPRKPAMSPYGNTKTMCEDILRDTVKANGGAVKGILLRYFNPIGAHPSALIGELPRGVPNNLVPYITQTAIGKRECLSIFGNDYPTPDGTCLRDYIDIVDLAKAHVYAVTRMIEGKMKEDCEVFNIGTGRPVSVLELVFAFEKVNGVPVPHKFAPRRPGDVTAIWADPTLANEEMGWKATRTVEETLAAAWAWEKHLAEQ